MAKPDSVAQVRAEVSREVGSTDFVQRLAKRVGLSARASAVFGDPVEQKRVTVIPVAKARWGVGGGSGGRPGEEGSGGGGGSIVTPIGFIEVREGEARFVRIRDLRLTALRLGVIGATIAWLARRR
jgi:uncharacterized spore protein YtfJ